MKYEKQVLSNGLTIVTVPSSDAESVVVDIFVKTGSRSEAKQEAGVSHFLEHFLFKGTKKYPTAMAINEIVDGIGGDMNAFTSKEVTQYYIKARSKYLPLIFDILTDMVQQPLFDPAELEKEKGVIVEEMNMYKDMPQAVVDEALDLLMWPKDVLGQPIIGRKETITSFSPKIFHAYMRRHYQPSNMMIGVSGKFNSRELRNLIKKSWGPVKKQRAGGWRKVTDVQTKPRFKLLYKETEQAQLALGFKGFANNDKRNPAMTVLSTILGGGMSSRLWDEIREKRGLAYYVRCSGGSYQDTGQFVVSAGVQIPKIQEAVEVIFSELKRVVDVLVDEKELLKAKEYLKGKTALALEDNQVRLDWYLDQVAFKKVVLSPQAAYDRIDAVTRKDVQAVAQQLFRSAQASLAVLGPYKDGALEKSLQKAIKF
ncbi:MAG: insulinase family protein [Candidatus Doudnabacteria bacterium]|nr:insulinase family protein [Candidatus Doudnabacteria bacterium]